MVCLLTTRDVILLSNDAHSRIVFPSPTHLPSDFSAYRPPQAARAITTARILCNENMFATVSSAGEIFTFNAPTPPLPGERPSPVQPQRVWALRKQWSAVNVRPEPSFFLLNAENALTGRGPWWRWVTYYMHSVGACLRALTEWWC